MYGACAVSSDDRGGGSGNVLRKWLEKGDEAMLDAMYEWMKNLAFYLVIVTAVLEVLPGEAYRKYVRFFAGIVLILLILTPLLQVTGSFGTFQTKYRNHESELIRQEIMESREYFEEADVFEFLEKETDGVEEIEIGENKRSDFDVDTYGGETSGETTAAGDSVDRTVAAGDRDSGARGE